MFDLHWSVALIPIVAIGVAVFALIARKHKDKSSTDHILKL
jgi:hypothetical protein